MSETKQPLVEALFDLAAQKPTAAERAEFLDGVCRDNPALRARLDVLLEGHFAGEGFLTQAPERDAPSAPRIDEAPPPVIGRYKLLEKIGEGGFGEVWMAEQREPVKRRVALKIIKLGMDSRQIVARFEAERQALAMMDHPNIAKIFDAGTTEPMERRTPVRRDDACSTSANADLEIGAPFAAGRPYFVMELVRGIKITEYCDQNQLPTQERLRLFILVCQAIQHAHQKGIIHRDIKPSNILVTLHDGVPVPKVIDFGIAKATQQELTDKTVFTQFQQFIGTQAYISPEQAEMSGLDIDTRADIYSLGVLLYELLVGQTPFDAKEMMQGGLDALRQIIREKEPLRPSTKLNTLQGDARTTAGKRRQTDVGKLMHQLQGDLDWIVMKCLEKDRTRRYETANGLASDIQRHLNDEAVLACPPTAAYRLQKLVRRNKLALAAVAAVTFTLIAGLSFSTWAFLREAAQRRTAVKSAEQARQAEQKAESAAATITRNLYFAEMNLAGNAASEAGGISRVTDLTAKWLPDKDGTDQRGWEWYYLRSLLHLDLFTLSAHSRSVRSVAWGPDGKRVASGSDDNTIKIWDAASRQVTLTLIEHTNKVTSVAWSPDGKRLASGSEDNTIKVWDAVSGQVIHTLSGHSGLVLSVAWSPDGKRLASGSWDGTIKVWDVDGGQVIHNLTGHKLYVPSVSWSPDGKRLASGGADFMVRLWDAGGGTNINTLAGHFDTLRSVSWSPDGKRLASGGEDDTIKVWDAISGRNTFTHRGHYNDVFSVAWSPDGKQLASGGDDRTIKVWDATSEESLILRGHTNQVSSVAWMFSVAWSPDGKHLASAGFDNTVKIRDSASGQESRTLSGHTNEVHSVAWSPDGKFLVSGSRDSTIKVWDVTSGHVNLTLPTHADKIAAVSWSPDGKRLASGTGEHDTINLYDATSGQMTMALTGHMGTVHSVVWSPDGKFLASGSWDGTVRVWDAVSGEVIHLLRAESGFAEVAWSRDGKHLAAGGFDKTVRIWDAVSGQLIQTLRGHSEALLSVSWSPDGKRLASGSFDGTVKVWDTASGHEAVTLRGHTKAAQSVAWSPDGKRLASGGYDHTVTIWDARKGYALERE